MQADKRLNILFLSGWYPSRTHRTLGNFVQRHAEAVATMHHVHVLYLAADKDIKVAQEIETSTSHGVKSTIVYYRKSIFPFYSQWEAFRRGINELKRRGEFDFDLVHLNVIWPAGWQALYLHRRYSIPFVVTEHWTGYDTGARKHPGMRVASLAKKVARKAAIICPVTENLGQMMRDFGLSGKYEVVANVVDTSVFQVGNKSKAPCTFLHVSSLNEDQKNISGILRAWKRVSDAREDVHLLIGGDGPWEKVESASRKLGIRSSSISFFGELPSEEIAAMMQPSHALVMFSNYENLPCVIVEAMASGMAIISTDVGGIREHVNPSNGYLVARGDEDEFAEAMLRFSQDRNNFQPEQLRSYAIQHFSIPSIALQFTRVYTSVLESSKKSSSLLS